MIIEELIIRILKHFNLEIHRSVSLSRDYLDTISLVQPHTMTSVESIIALIDAVKYLVRNNIPSDIVECGVWKGGSMMAVAKTLLDLNKFDRNLYIFDTFMGMTKPYDEDKLIETGEKASKIYDKEKMVELPLGIEHQFPK